MHIHINVFGIYFRKSTERKLPSGNKFVGTCHRMVEVIIADESLVNKQNCSPRVLRADPGFAM